jgi:DNA-directed RNA polymerase subunit beta'
VLGGLASGLDAHEYFMCCAATDRVRRDVARRSLVAARLFDMLQAALGDVAIVAGDCGATAGTVVRALRDDGATVSLGQRVRGQIVIEPVTAPSGELLAPAGALITTALADQIDALDVSAVVVRDVLACQAEGGVCARCAGLGPEDAIWPAVGDDLGARAARAIAQAALWFGDHYFHIC